MLLVAGLLMSAALVPAEEYSGYSLDDDDRGSQMSRIARQVARSGLFG